MTASGSAAGSATTHPTASSRSTTVARSIADAGDAAGQVGRERDDDGLVGRLDGGHADVGAAAVRDQQRGGAGGGVRREHAVDPALEATRRLARQLVPTRHVRDRSRREVRRLQRDLGAVVVDLGVEPAHRAGEPDRSAVVGDEQVGRVEGPGDVVERLERLAGPGTAYDDGTAQPRAVEGVQRLTRLEHDVVRDVDGERDRAHAAHREPAPHPVRRRRGRVEPDDGAQREEVAAREVVDDALVRDRRRRVLAARRARCPGRGTARSTGARARARCRASTGRSPCRA